MKKELSKDKLDSILLELSNTSIANEKEMDRRNSINPFHKSRTEQKGFRFQNVKNNADSIFVVVSNDSLVCIGCI